MKPEILRTDLTHYTLVTMKGNIPPEMLISWIDEYMKSRVSQNTLWDLQEVALTEIDPAMFKELSEYLHSIGDKAVDRSAFLFDNELDSFLGQAFNHYTEQMNLGLNDQVFTNKDEAEMWLTEQ